MLEQKVKMKRKIIKQGHNTLTITLPSKWAKNLSLEAGNEINLTEKDNGLFLSAEKNNGEKKKVEIDISGLDIPTIWKHFMAVYREGYDEIKVIFPANEKYESPYKFFTQHSHDKVYEKGNMQTPIEFLNSVVHRFVGLEIIEHRENYCIIKNMVELTEKEFESSLRRVFLLIQQMGEELVEAVNKNNTELLKHTHDIDINVDKFHDYCIRVLNKTSFKGQKSSLIFSTLFILEMLGDECKNVANHITNEKDIKLENLKELTKLVFEHFNNFYDLFYKFDSSKVVAMSKRDMDIYFYLPKLYQKKNNKSKLSDSELEIFNHLRRITRYTNALIELRIEMEF